MTFSILKTVRLLAPLLGIAAGIASTAAMAEGYVCDSFAGGLPVLTVADSSTQLDAFIIGVAPEDIFRLEASFDNVPATVHVSAMANGITVVDDTVIASGSYSGSPVSFGGPFNGIVQFSIEFFQPDGVDPLPVTAATLTLYCSDTPPVIEPEANLGNLQETVLHDSSLRSSEMITDLVNASVEATYNGNADGANSFMGYAGTVMVATPFEGAEPGQSGFFWGGLKYHWLFGNDDQWTGGQVTGAGGVNYLVDESSAVGAFAAYEKSGLAIATTSQSMDGSGYSLGVTTAYRAGDWRLELMGYGTRLAYSLDESGTTGAFGAWRAVLDGKLSGTLPLTANVDLVPVGQLSVVREWQEAYTDSASVAHGELDLLAARASAGGELVFYPTNGGMTLSAGAFADYWTTQNQSNSGLTGRVKAGAKFDLSDMTILGVNGSLDSIGGKQLGATVDASLKAGF